MSKDKPSGGKHDSGQTSTNPKSGDGGRHSKPEGYPLGSRTTKPHDPKGWGGR